MCLRAAVPVATSVHMTTPNYPFRRVPGETSSCVVRARLTPSEAVETRALAEHLKTSVSELIRSLVKAELEKRQGERVGANPPPSKKRTRGA